MTLQFVTADCLEWMCGQPADRFDLVCGSPPYVDCRTYGIGAQRDCLEWIAWMLEVTEAAANICRGPVIWVAAGATRKRNYWPACEGLMYEWWKRGGTHELYRPCIFHRVGIPGSGGTDWFRADTEYVMCFKRPGALPWSDNTAHGHPPKWAPGGEMSYRNTEGTRRNQWGHSGGGRNGSRTAEGDRQDAERPSHVVTSRRDKWGRDASTGNRDANGDRKPQTNNGRKVQTRRKANGTRPGARGHDGMHNQEQDYQEPVLANPGNVWRIKVGGGVMGNPLCHENEAPYPEALAERIVLACCPPGGWCLDPFSGSGTTAAVCQEYGRNCVGVDVRESQTDLARRRCAEIQRSLIT